jgi:hypothetical protein
MRYAKALKYMKLFSRAGRKPYKAEPVFHSTARTAPNADLPSARDA